MKLNKKKKKRKKLADSPAGHLTFYFACLTLSHDEAC